MTRHRRYRGTFKRKDAMTTTFPRRQFLTLFALGAGSAVFGRAMPASAQGKVSKAMARYQTSPKGNQQCSKCHYFIPKNDTCQLVEGKISPDGWCRFFVPKS